MNYKIFIQTLGGGRKWEIPYQNASFQEVLNEDRFANISFDWEELKVIADADNIEPYFIHSGGYREVYIYDEDDNLLYGGFLNNPIDSFDENGGATLSIQSKGFFSLLSKRHTDKEEIFESNDSADIAWDLIDSTQTKTNGDLGIIRGTHPTTKTRDRTFYREDIKSAIEGMSLSKVKEGFEFEIDNNKIFNIFYPEKGTQRTGFELRIGQNVNSGRISSNGPLGMCNTVYAQGKGQGLYSLEEEVNAETIFEETYGLLEDVLPEKDVSVSTTLINKGERYLDFYKKIRRSIMVNVFYENPSWLSYNVGDQLKFVYPARNIDQYYRVYSRKLNLRTDEVQLTLKEI
jgi:hypothetical protein